MHIILIRHGDAGDSGPQWPDDRERPLTRNGLRQARQAGEFCARLGLTPTHAFSSPLVRTRETAEQFLKAFKDAPKLQFSGHLAPGGRIEKVLEETAGAGERDTVLFCGHNPSIGELADHLGTPLGFTKAAMALFSLKSPGRPARLEFFIRPDWVEGLQKQ